MKVVAIILAFNEAQHLPRCVESLEEVATEVLVVDCFSTDGTATLARELGARVVEHEWRNYSTQFNWALTQVDPSFDWVLRIDADEYLTPDLVAEIRAKLPLVEAAIDGVVIGRRIAFQGRVIRHGGISPIRVLRLFRIGRGQCEVRWMDEHIRVEGPTVEFAGDMIDDNKNSLTWWIDKHNKYASREAVDLLNLEFGFEPIVSVARLDGAGEAGKKRWLKERVYAKLPGGLRALAYFSYRYVVRFGFLDGSAGLTFHVLQGLWYRYLVDEKVAEVKRRMQRDNLDIKSAIEVVLGIRL